MDNTKDAIYTRLKTLKEEAGASVISPLFCDVLVSERCNLHCKKCYFWKSKTPDALTLEEYKNFILSLKDFDKVPLEINLGGGEPLLKDGILELIRFSDLQGIKPAISTNATLIDKDMAKSLSDCGLSRLSISLESLDEKVHDFITGTPGSYASLMRGIEYLKRYWRTGSIHIHTVITGQNMQGILDMAGWVNKDAFFSGIAFIALAQPFLTATQDQWHLNSEYGLLWPKDHNHAAAAIDALINYKRAGYKIINPLSQLAVYKRYYNNPGAFARAYQCNFGEYIFNVNVLGLVHLCCFMPPIGNIKEKSIKEIWYSKEAERTRDLMRNCQKSCNNIMNCYFQDDGEAAKENT